MGVIDTARKYLGQKEGQGNTFDDSTPLGKLVKLAGQKNGEAWCCYFGEGVFCEALPEKEPELRKLFSANCFQTYVNFLQAGYKCSLKPVPGALVIFQYLVNGVLTTRGHAGICETVISETQFTCIEGNTNEAGSREGNTVAVKTRDTLKRDNGLVVVCFIIIE